MRVYRLSAPKHAKTSLVGEGARMFGGRWNPRGFAMVYTSEHLSLAILENLVHLEPAQLQPTRVALTIEVSNRDVEVLAPSALPKNWRAARSQGLLQDLGKAWLAEGRSLALKVPSAVLPQEHNILINPNHPKHDRLSVEAEEPFSFDPRLFRFPT